MTGVSKIAGVVSVLLGVISLASLVLGLASPAMQPATAVAFVVSGIALWLFTNDSSQFRRLASICAAGVIALSILAAAERLFGWDLNMNGLLSKDSLINTDIFDRMDITVAAMFIALGLALALLGNRTHAAKARVIGFGAGIVSLLLLAVYYYAVPALDSFVTIPPSTGLGFLSLAIGVVTARSRPGAARNAAAARESVSLLARLMPGRAESGSRGGKPDGRRELELLRILRESAVAMAGAAEPNAARDLLLEKTEILFPFASTVTLRMAKPGTEELEAVATRTASDVDWAIDENQALGSRAVKPLSTKAPMSVRNLQTDGQVSNQLYRKQGWVSYLGVPLLARGQAIGILGVYTKEEHEFSREEGETLAALAAEAAGIMSAAPAPVAVETATPNAVEATSEQTLRALQLLPDVYAALASLNQTESMVETFNGVIDKVVGATAADAAILRIWKKETGASLVAVHRGMVDDHAKQMEVGLLKGAVEWVMQNSAEIVAADIDAEPRFETKVQQQLGFRSAAVLPLKMHNVVRGVLYLASHTIGRFDMRDKDLFIAIAQQIGIAMENRELFDHLKNSRDEIEKASKIKGEFLSVMSHELRTPLSVVMGYAGMIKERMLGEINPQQDDALQKLLTRANDQLNMINAIMQITQLESRSLVLERHLVNLTEMLTHLKADYALSHTKQQVAIHWQLPAEPVVIVTDGGKLKEILVNLINNAIKFTPEGTISVSMSVQEDHRKKWVHLSVADTGVGIPKEQFNSIFEKFYQVDSSETRLYGGVGLGLYIVKHFAEFLGGKVDVASEPGRGSKFTVTIPYAT